MSGTDPYEPAPGFSRNRLATVVAVLLVVAGLVALAAVTRYPDRPVTPVAASTAGPPPDGGTVASVAEFAQLLADGGLPCPAGSLLPAGCAGQWVLTIYPDEQTTSAYVAGIMRAPDRVTIVSGRNWIAIVPLSTVALAVHSIVGGTLAPLAS